MAVGFKRSLFGFKCDDVMNYIEKSHQAFSQKENSLNDEISVLSNSVENLKEANIALEKEKATLEAQLNEFKAKSEEMERLSENIGKLYLVSQTNSRTIMDNALRESTAAKVELARNLSAIETAHESLRELRLNIMKTIDNFSGEVDSLISDLDHTKQQLAVDAESTNTAKAEFQRVYNTLTKL